jgi:hypothetical protein
MFDRDAVESFRTVNYKIHQTFPRRTGGFLRSVKKTKGSGGSEHTGIEEVELGVLDSHTSGPLPEDRKPEAEQKILQHQRKHARPTNRAIHGGFL